MKKQLIFVGVLSLVFFGLGFFLMDLVYTLILDRLNGIRFQATMVTGQFSNHLKFAIIWAVIPPFAWISARRAGLISGWSPLFTGTVIIGFMMLSLWYYVGIFKDEARAAMVTDGHTPLIPLEALEISQYLWIGAIAGALFSFVVCLVVAKTRR